MEELDLVDYRRRVGNLYRATGDEALARFRRGRDELFAHHSQSPIADRASFTGIEYFPPDPTWRVVAELEPSSGEDIKIETGGADGAIHYRRAGTLRFTAAGAEHSLTVLSIVAYGGGIFLPFKDATSGRETYGGGRYLFDTVKNTDGLALEVKPGSSRVMLDFNYAYNPSCAYSPRWACPLAPPENTIAVPVRVGEKVYLATSSAYPARP